MGGLNLFYYSFLPWTTVYVAYLDLDLYMGVGGLNLFYYSFLPWTTVYVAYLDLDLYMGGLNLFYHSSYHGLLYM